MFEYALSVMIFLPILAGLALLLFPVSKGAARIIGFIVSVVILFIGIESVPRLYWNRRDGIRRAPSVDRISWYQLRTRY